MKQYCTVTNTLVKDHRTHRAYNLNNKHDAIQLCETLNTAYKTLDTYKDIDAKYDKMTKTLIQIQMSLKIVEDEVNSLSEMMTK